MKREPIASSNIRSVGFEDGRMHIEFANGRVYEYTGSKVAEHYKNLMAAESKGSYFFRNIRGCTDTKCQRVEEPQ